MKKLRSSSLSIFVLCQFGWKKVLHCDWHQLSCKEIACGKLMAHWICIRQSGNKVLEYTDTISYQKVIYNSELIPLKMKLTSFCWNLTSVLVAFHHIQCHILCSHISMGLTGFSWLVEMSVLFVWVIELSSLYFTC